MYQLRWRHLGDRWQPRCSLGDLQTDGLGLGLGLGSADSSGIIIGKINLEHLWPRDPESRVSQWGSEGRTSLTRWAQDQCWSWGKKTKKKGWGGITQISTIWALRGLIYPHFCWGVIYTPAAIGQIIPVWLCRWTNTSVLTSLKYVLWTIISAFMEARTYFPG